MAAYSIKDLENFTNIKAHTLRIWEQRYNLLEPKRTNTNIRYYSDRDLKKILNINLLYSHGYKISKIAQLSEEEIMKRATELLHLEDQLPDDHVTHFVKYIVELNESAIQQKLQELYAELGVQQLYTQILIPLLQRVGDLWQVDAISVSNEHFFSNILRDFFTAETARLPEPAQPVGKVVLFLHEREMHELSLLYYRHMLKSKGYLCYYLGQSVPIKDLKRTVTQIKPDYLFTSIISETDHDFFADFMKQLFAVFNPSKMYMGGAQLDKLKAYIPEQVHRIYSHKDINF